jgi:hypothetical protein
MIERRPFSELPGEDLGWLRLRELSHAVQVKPSGTMGRNRINRLLHLLFRDRGELQRTLAASLFERGKTGFRAWLGAHLWPRAEPSVRTIVGS